MRLNRAVCWMVMLAWLIGDVDANAQTLTLGQPAQTAGVLLPPTGAAIIDEATAPEVNPAGIGLLPGPELIYLHERSLRFDRLADSLFVGAKIFHLVGLNLALQGVRPDNAPHYRKTTWTLALGSKVAAVGLSYNTFGSDDFALNRLTSFDAGLTLRPFSFLALGAAVHDLDGPQLGNVQLARRYDVGLGLRPLAGRASDRLTLGADLLINSHDGFHRGLLKFVASLEPIDGLVVQAGLGTGFHGENAVGQVALTLNFNHFGVSWSGASDFEDVSEWEQLVQLRLSAARYRGLPLMRGQYVVLDIENELHPTRSTLSKILSSGEPDPYLELLSLLKRLRDDQKVSGVVLKVTELSDLGHARIEELRAALVDLRQAKKQLVALFFGGGDNEYYLASAADHIWAVPQASFLINGFSASVVFLGQTLSKVGVTVDVARVGSYKTAPDSLTRSDMSPQEREVLNAYLDGLMNNYLTTLSQARGIDLEQLKKIIAQGLLTAPAAQAAGLIDGVIYPDELTKLLEKSAQKSIALTNDYAPPPSWPQKWGLRPRIAVINVEGDISEGRSGSAMGLRRVAGSQTVIRLLEQALTDVRTAAIVLRVDSPGGSGAASDLIWRAIRKVREHKPVIVSMGDLAASGGYYVAMAGNRIFAEPSTITGSIGVFTLKPNFAPVLDKLGVHFTTLRRGERADLYSLTRPWTPSELEIVQKNIDEFYDQFITKVAQSRGLDKSKVNEIAQGRVWSGEAAKRLGLVDELGGLPQAISAAKHSAGLQNQEVDVELLSEDQGFSMLSLVGESEQQARISSLLKTYAAPLGLSLIDLPDGPLAMMPYQIVIK